MPTAAYLKTYEMGYCVFAHLIALPYCGIGYDKSCLYETGYWVYGKKIAK